MPIKSLIMSIKRPYHIFTFAAILSFFSLYTHAQQFNGGFLGGVAASQISGDALGGFDKPGVYLGVFANYNLKPEQSLQLEMSFIQKGSRKTPNFEIGDFSSYLLNMNYLEIPVWYRYMPVPRFGLEGSLSWAFLFSYKEEDHNGLITRPPGTPEFRNFDISTGGGFYYEWSRNLSMHFRITHSVVPVREHASGASYRFNYGQYHNVMMFSLHYQFNKME
jgi:hypothetical protein